MTRSRKRQAGLLYAAGRRWAHLSSKATSIGRAARSTRSGPDAADARPLRTWRFDRPHGGVFFRPSAYAEFAGRTGTGESYLTWQLFRRPNHDWLFYPTTVPEAIGPLVLLAAGLGLWLLRRESSWRETLLLCWVAVPVVFFQLWPVKGFQYLLPVAPAIAVLAARGITRTDPKPALLRGVVGQPDRSHVDRIGAPHTASSGRPRMPSGRREAGG